MTTDLMQGDPRLLHTDTAQSLLRSTIPARMSYLALDGTPRVVPTWHVWTGEDLVMSAFLYCEPTGITRPAARLRALRAHPTVAVVIDSEPQPPDVLTIRGDVTITETDGMTPEQAQAARRFLGDDAGTDYIAAADHPATRMARIALRPSWVGLLDFRTRVPTIMKAGATTIEAQL